MTDGADPPEPSGSADEPDPGPIGPGGDLGAALEGYRSRAPRLRRAALVLVGLALATMLGFVLLAPDRAGDTIVSTDGQVCALVDGQVWRSESPFLPEPAWQGRIEGRWVRTGEQTAVLVTSKGRVLDLWADQVRGGEQPDSYTCAFHSSG